MIKNHPFAVEAHFESSIVLTFSFPKEELQKFIPECLELDTFKDKWAFIAIAMVETKGLRPQGFPRFLGNDFFLIGYRIFVRYSNEVGKRLRGLYILKSETDKKKMQILGNLFTHYKYTTTDILKNTIDGITTIKSNQSQFQLVFDELENCPLPTQTPFGDWKEARRYAGPLPFTFTYNDKTKKVLIIEGVRENWIPQPLRILEYNFDFFNTLNIGKPQLANAFIIKNIPYHWKKGKIETYAPAIPRNI
jgi:hypothetical protein